MTILEMINTIYSQWTDAIKDKVTGYSMENSATVTKLPYATMYFTGIPGDVYKRQGKRRFWVSPMLKVGQRICLPVLLTSSGLRLRQGKL